MFYSEDPAAVPIDTDPAAELENIRRSIGKPMIRNYLALLLLCLVEVAFQCYQIWTDPVDTLASANSLLAATAYLPLRELVDIAAELERIRKEIEKAQNGLRSVEQKLSNEKFVSRAPEAVVNAEREKAAKYKELIAKLEESAKAMQA